MFLNRIVLGGLYVAGVLASLGTPASADNINTSGVACKNYNASEALDIDYHDYGVRNLNASPRWVTCPAPRSPLISIPVTGFYVDGSNSPGTSTSCVASLYTYQGTIVTTVLFTESVPGSASSVTPWSHPVTFSIAPAHFDYVSVRCILPGSGASHILGVTAVQP
jgi:hypothetical protein